MPLFITFKEIPFYRVIQSLNEFKIVTNNQNGLQKENLTLYVKQVPAIIPESTIPVMTSFTTNIKAALLSLGNKIEYYNQYLQIKNNQATYFNIKNVDAINVNNKFTWYIVEIVEKEYTDNPNDIIVNTEHLSNPRLLEDLVKNL